RTMPLVTSRLRLSRRRMFCQAISTALLSGREIWRWIGAAEVVTFTSKQIGTRIDTNLHELTRMKCKSSLNGFVKLRQIRVDSCSNSLFPHFNCHCDQAFARQRVQEGDGRDLGLTLVEIVLSGKLADDLADA